MVPGDNTQTNAQDHGNNKKTYREHCEKDRLKSVKAYLLVQAVRFDQQKHDGENKLSIAGHADYVVRPWSSWHESIPFFKESATNRLGEFVLGWHVRRET